ncbi:MULTISPECIES: hypothetical protein [Cohaesibacter]|nr:MULTISPECIES: hypothetical protein [Cohaesibacter]
MSAFSRIFDRMVAGRLMEARRHVAEYDHLIDADMADFRIDRNKDLPF